MKITFTQALTILQLQTPFTMADLKKAYRAAALVHHPDCGGKAENFIKIDAAYDFLKSFSKDFAQATSNSYWEQYWQSRLHKLQEQFQEEWRKAFKKALAENNGMWFSTCIERFGRAYMYPRTEWFLGVLYKKATTKNRNAYQQKLLLIAPNRTFREQYALKYYRLEFGFDTPYVFYLPPAKEQIGVVA
ncbi:J domain-containing protein [Anabaena azotica FACHB-119]|uniref:J domain-containing protein n=2 Tax=Anabaena azotica TaxID=197653 RepID=A0ABR8DHJ0_9NOST|nr:J domain-containing protein [Anabaena azotica FACHB-119]